LYNLKKQFRTRRFLVFRILFTKLTDFEKSQFIHTKLYAADFTEAQSYSIDPTQNDIRKAKFSLPDAIHLLDGFDIQII
jgi:fluoroquinolone resistance protein